MRLRYRFALGATLFTLVLILGANLLLARQVPEDWQQAEDTLRGYLLTVGAALLAALGALISGSVAGFVARKRELGVACLYGAVFVALTAISARAAFSAWDWIYLPAAAALGALVSVATGHQVLSSFFLGAFLATLVAATSIKLFMQLN